MTEDAPLEPEAWSTVHHALRRLYIGFWLTYLACGIGLIPTFLGHRDLARWGPTADVRAISRLRLWLIPFRVVAAAFVLVVDARTDSAASVAIAGIPVVLASILELELWSRLGIELARWSGSAALTLEWARARFVYLASFATGAASVGLWSVDGDALVGPAIVTTVAAAALSIWFHFTTWRTYSLFAKPLVPAYAAARPPSSGQAAEWWTDPPGPPGAPPV